MATGHKTPGSGRKKGSRNKRTAIVDSRFAKAVGLPAMRDALARAKAAMDKLDHSTREYKEYLVIYGDMANRIASFETAKPAAETVVRTPDPLVTKLVVQFV